MKSTFFLATFLSLVSTIFALEPWADNQLPIRDGVELWLDAARQPAAREARKLPAASSTLEVWLDGSGRARDVAQSAVAAQPRWQQSAGGALVRFDGKDDWLGATKLGAAFENATVFVVAAPRTNPGTFRGFVSWAETARNDYLTGFNLDLGGGPTSTFTALNAEGAGFRGEYNLLNTQFDFGTFHVFSVVSAPGAGGVKLFLDGGAEGSRDRAPSIMRMDDLAIGARLIAMTDAPSAAQSFLDGDIAEVLVYGRALSDAERAQVERYLIAKHRVVKPAPLPGAKPLVPVKNPPLVQMLVPGFTARALPFDLTNIDCLRYRADGKLVAGAYNGKIWLLSDTDGDGLEDKAELYWESAELKAVIGMALTPPGDPRGQGVFVATQGRILFIPDKNGDDHGDEERVVASGWEKQVVGGGGGIVDALGLTMGPDGDLFFGLGTSAYNNAYLLDKTTGAASYSLGSERGTVQRVSADFSKRETVCSGIRYPVGAAFNALGDLFMTEQEGATWLPNGNPFDELVFIERGRHYGFPPAHPKHLPGVIDEPSVFDYAPQHQSTCGLVFNGPQSFGPPWWAGDALVAGESRGKLWRTKLVKTAVGYVAQNQLIGALTMLAVDVAVSPRGEFAVACHSGGPDWGTGPNGAGKIFKIALTDKSAPQPVLAWSASPTELRVAFDRELDLTKLKDFAKKPVLERGLYVSAADRFESFRPGYQAVKDQMAAPRFEVPVLAVSVSADRRELTLITAPRTAAMNYALTLPGLAATEIDLASDLTGVTAEWKSSDGQESWSGWLPHPDLAVAHAMTAGSASHARLFELLAKPGQLKLRGQLDLWEMLHPAIQPGAKLDYERPTEMVTVRLHSKESDRVMTRESRAGEWLPFDVTIPTGAGEPEFTASWSTADDTRPRAFPLRRILLPWAQAKVASATMLTEREIPEIQGGNWLRGRKLFFGKATCAVCHKVGTEGGIVGPDLSNLTQRDYASVVRDIREPSAALNPDRLAYSIETKAGAAFAGVLLGEEGGELRFADVTGAIKNVPRAGLKSMEALSTSLMPPGLLDVLAPAEQRDLLTFLLMPPMEPAPLEAANPPPPRPRAEVAALLKSLNSDQLKIQNSKFKIVLCAGPKDHGRGEHDYGLWQKRWSRLLSMADGVEVSTAWIWPSAEQWQSADVIAFFSKNPGWNANRAPEMDAYLARGGGLAYFHFAVDGNDDAPLLADRIGLAIEKSACKYRHGPVEFTMHLHALTAGLPPLQLLDETYWDLRGDESRLQLLASAIEDGAPRPQIWTREQGAGRVFVSVPGHYNWTFDDPLYRAIAFRGLCWAARQPIDRLAELIPIGARIGE
jgi:putative heme-binding domain-containing protein